MSLDPYEQYAAASQVAEKLNDITKDDSEPVTFSDNLVSMFVVSDIQKFIQLYKVGERFVQIEKLVGAEPGEISDYFVAYNDNEKSPDKRYCNRVIDKTGHMGGKTFVDLEAFDDQLKTDIGHYFNARFNSPTRSPNIPLFVTTEELSDSVHRALVDTGCVTTIYREKK